MNDTNKTKAQLIRELEMLRQQFAEQRNLMQTILDNVPDFIYVKDTASRFILSNAAHLRSMGMKSLNDVLGKTDLELFPKELGEQFYADEQALLETERPILRKEERSLDETGKHMWALTTKVLLRDHMEQVIGLVGITHDITDLKNAQEALSQLNAELEQRVAERTSELTEVNEQLQEEIIRRTEVEKSLRESEMRYRGLFNRIPIGLYRSTPDGQFIDVNQAFIDMLGYPDRESMLEQEASQNYVNPTDREVWKAALALDNAVSDYTLNLKRRDGTNIWVETSARVIFEGGNLYYDGAVQDITERKETMAALQRSEARAKGLLEAIPDMVFRLDRDGTYLDYKAKTEELVDQSGQIIGKKIADHFPPELKDMILEYIGMTLVAGEMQIFEYQLSMPQGLLDYEARMVKSGDAEVTATVRDITERRQLESQRINLALERERMEILQHFITQASHEFRTPLASINTSTHLLQKVGIDAKQGRYIDKIEEEVSNITSLVDDLTILSKLSGTQELATQTLDCCKLVADVYAKHLTAVEFENIHSVLDLKTQPLFVQGNETYLLWAIEALVNNAIRFSPEGGVITLGVDRGEDNAIIEIIDTGIGVSEDDLPHIFERFYRSDKAGTTRGFGLGLPIAKASIELHKGSIEVESTVGEGSTFRILLPLES